ncbi:MAG: DUF4129 domain-containing protein [Streptosporangiaceae bacterium]|nr:DUF4129 domain-containing protein [Streptosporangiaceae bacterium]
MTSRQPGRPARVLLLTLLIIAGLGGLQAQVTPPRWDGPLHRDAVVVGSVLEFLLGIMLVVTIRRVVTRARAGTAGAAPATAVPAKLRWVLVFVLSAGMIAVAVIMLVGLHQHLFSGSARARPGQGASAAPSSLAGRPGRHFLFTLHVHVPAAVLYGLVGLTFLGGVALRVWWVRRFRPAGRFRAYDYTANDPQDLREAVQAGRSALRAIDDARAAIIACYLAMEASLAERGAARASADTPSELLRRATATGIVHGTAAGRLTALFYEARFSSHPLDRGQRGAAGQALSELLATLAEGEVARIPGRRRQANRRRANRSGAHA